MGKRWNLILATQYLLLNTFFWKKLLSLLWFTRINNYFDVRNEKRGMGVYTIEFKL